ncbi:MAG TPA: YciI family protein [Myxococcota bacterium]|nr:YciI family protein [Myxococcota bacterium]
MDYMLVILSRRGEAPREDVGMAEMGKFAAELAQSGRLRGGAPLHPEAQGARLRVRNGRAEVVDGPFTESKEIVGGYFMFEAASREEALELAQRCPAARAELVQLNEAYVDREGETTDGPRWLLLFLQTPAGVGDPDGSRYREMTKWVDELKAEKRHEECASLAAPGSAPGARIEVRAGRTMIVDGPFTESKEVIGGFAIAVANDRDEALSLAGRCPHARWGEIEIRQVMKVPGPPM